jgi:hypothetical protein
MEFKTTKHVGLMAVVVDEQNETSETIRVDTLRMMSFVINYATKQCIMAFVWGGYDSTGKFHMDPNRPASHRTLNALVDGEREVWDACVYEDDKGNPRKCFDQAFFEKVLIEHKQIDVVVKGGWALDELELKHGNPTVFRKERRPGPPV